MKPSMILLTIAAVAGTSAACAQSIKVSQPVTKVALPQSAHPNAQVQSVGIHQTTSPNWTRVIAHQDASGKLVARCTVETNPQVAARRAGKTTTTQHKK